MSLPTARQVINSVEHEAIDSVEATYDSHIVRFIDGSYISATHHTKGEVPEYHPEIEDEDSEQWEEPAGYNWIYAKPDEDERDAAYDADDNPAALEGAIIRAADDALERHPWPHTQVLTTTVVSDYGDSATVSWIPEEITGYDEAKDNAGMREWVWGTVDDAPVFWMFEPSTRTHLLKASVRRLTGTHELVVTAHRVHHPNELEPGTFWVHP